MNDCRDPLVDTNGLQLLLFARIAPTTAAAGMTPGSVALGGQELFGVSHQDGFEKGVGFQAETRYCACSMTGLCRRQQHLPSCQVSTIGLHNAQNRTCRIDHGGMRPVHEIANAATSHAS
jgi:hypothetical protein